MIGATLYRLVAELACLAGVISAAVLAYADKSAWIWCWFLLFGLVNMVTGSSSAKAETKQETKTESAAPHRSAA